MQLSEWLKQSKSTRADFARTVEISPGRVTQICEGELPSLDLAERIAKVTAGALTPNDFVRLVPSQQWINRLMDETEQGLAAAHGTLGRVELRVVPRRQACVNGGDPV